VAPANDNLRNLIHRSELSRHRILESTINHHHLAFYQQLHGVTLEHNQPILLMPCDKNDLRRIRKRLTMDGARGRNREMEVEVEEPETEDT